MAKRENDSFSIEDLMKSFIKENNLSKGMQKIKVEETWIKMMGPGVANHTTSVKLQNKTLVIQLNSSVLREELSYGKDKIIKMMNEELGETVVTNKRRNYKFAVSKDLNQAALQELAEMLQNNAVTNQQKKKLTNAESGKQNSQENPPANNSKVEDEAKSQSLSPETNDVERDKYGFLIISDKYSEINFERKKLNYFLAKLVVVENDIEQERLEYAKKLIKTPLIPDDFEFKNMDKNQLHLLIVSKQIAEPFNDEIEQGQYKLAKEIIQTAIENPF